MSVRPVYLEAPYVPPSPAGTTPVTFGDATRVDAATMKLFDKEECQPGRDAGTVNPSWQKTVGYSLQGDQWAAVNGQVVSLSPDVIDGDAVSYGVTVAIQPTGNPSVVVSLAHVMLDLGQDGQPTLSFRAANERSEKAREVCEACRAALREHRQHHEGIAPA